MLSSKSSWEKFCETFPDILTSIIGNHLPTMVLLDMTKAQTTSQLIWVDLVTLLNIYQIYIMYYYLSILPLVKVNCSISETPHYLYRDKMLLLWEAITNFRSRRWGSSLPVCARLTVRSSPHQHKRKIFGARVWGGVKIFKIFF